MKGEKEIRIIAEKEKTFPLRLKNISPKVNQIYIEGNYENLNGFNIAIIGSRNSSKEGEKIAREFTRKLTDLGINIISGLALGIDTIAHKECIRNGGKTIAVIGSGFNNIYPEENYRLYENILSTGGTVVSEYSKDEPPNSKNFPKRNRIISALSDGILVVEGKYRSGTTITAQYGLSQNKPVFCIPHSIFNNYGTGPNWILKKGGIPVTDIKDILEYYSKKGMDFVQSKKEDKYNNEILQILSQEKLNKEELAIKMNKTISEINHQITLLELEEKIEDYGGIYRIIE